MTNINLKQDTKTPAIKFWKNNSPKTSVRNKNLLVAFKEIEKTSLFDANPDGFQVGDHEFESRPGGWQWRMEIFYFYPVAKKEIIIS